MYFTGPYPEGHSEDFFFGAEGLGKMKADIGSNMSYEEKKNGVNHDDL